jgi:hypothetical protein
MKEEWRPVSGYEGYYEVSSTGRVRSLNRVVNGCYGSTQPRESRVLLGTTPRKSHPAHGYRIVGLCRNGSVKMASVHRLVAGAFLPNPEGKPDVNHINGIRHDNRPENLEWCTTQENTKHRHEILKTTAKGERQGCSVLKNADVIRIRELRGSGMTLTKIGEVMGVSFSQVGKICSGKYWKHL